MNKITQLETVERLVKPVVESLGYHLVEREFTMDAGRMILRIYIDKMQPHSGGVGGTHTALPGGGATRAPVITKDGGVTLEDCSRVSQTLSAHLDVEDVIPGHYDLEVSSPGIERPLRYPEDFARYVGETVRLRTTAPVNGRQNYRGRLVAATDQDITMNVDGAEYTIPFSALLKARITKDWNQPK